MSSDNGGGGGVRFVKDENGVYQSPDKRFGIVRIEPGMGLSGTNDAGKEESYLFLGGPAFWLVWECVEGRRTCLDTAPTLRAARGLVAAHLKRTEAAAGTVEAAA